MKQLSFLALLLCMFTNAQQFKPADVTLKTGEKLTGNVFYNTPIFTPQVFDFKDENDKITKLDIKKVAEINIPDKAKFINTEISISRHAENLQNLGNEADFKLQNEQRFIEQIAFGKYNLYKYADNENKAYFYSMENSPEIKPLLFKEYFVEDGQKGTNKEYLKDLQNINCGEISFKNVRYMESSLIAYFNKINECNGVTNTSYKKVRGYTEHKVFGFYSKRKIGDEVGYGGGYEFEYHLPFLNYSFSVAAAPNYTKYEENQDIKFTETTTTSVMALPVLLRYYPIKTKDFKVFVSYSVLNFAQISETHMTYNNKKEYDKYFTAIADNFFELGLRFKNVEAFSRFHSQAGDNAMSVGLKYNIISGKK
ncbi:hypothetical protein EIB71_10430 [Kaistella daneshvariae]|jgi:hypothetical protein|uniref:Outer membrane protein beta-barrel domain-containing protein n=1 Tax=Kaistella daneshvariae TaxID=2487074 RepID=A0ABM7CAM5_9FLAO|nr:hypothetical protein [Kaistella daneshvariae]AZI68058.1 hypothetical protein EIB71_10430 [Kaistella daneshvariae]